MTRAEFLDDFQDILQRDDPVEPGTLLSDMEEWDSLAMMACLAYFDRKFGLKIKFAQLKDLRSVADVAALAQGNIQ